MNPGHGKAYSATGDSRTPKNLFEIRPNPFFFVLLVNLDQTKKSRGRTPGIFLFYDFRLARFPTAGSGESSKAEPEKRKGGRFRDLLITASQVESNAIVKMACDVPGGKIHRITQTSGDPPWAWTARAAKFKPIVRARTGGESALQVKRDQPRVAATTPAIR